MELLFRINHSFSSGENDRFNIYNSVSLNIGSILKGHSD